MATPLPNAVFGQLAELTGRSGPLLLALVGPNGAGKSTFYAQRLAVSKLPFINADLLAKALIEAGAPAGEATEKLAADLSEKRRREMMAKQESFITETVFSDPVGAKVQFLRDAQAVGYTVVMIFICVDSAELTAKRVESRVQDGGHSVPPDKIGPRYERMRKNVKAALVFVDFAIVVDNSSLKTPLRPVATIAKGKVVSRNYPLPWWALEVLPER